MGLTRGRVEVWVAIVVGVQAFTLSCSQSFEPAPQAPKLDKGGAEILLIQNERKLRAAGCTFELLPGASRLRDEKLSCTYDPRSQGAAAVADTLEQLGRFDTMTTTIRQYLDVGTSNVRPDKREQLEHRMLLLADAKADLKEQLRALYDDEARVQFAMASIGTTGCQIVGTKLACEEAVDLAQATEQIAALKRVESALGILFEGHAPVLKMPLLDYRELGSAISAHRERLEDTLRSEADSGGIGIKIPGEGANGIKSAISIDGGLFVSAAQTIQVAKTIDTMAKIIAQNGLAKDLRAKAYRRVVITPLVSEPMDVDFESTVRTVYLPDTMKPEEALEFLRVKCLPKTVYAAQRQAEGLARVEALAKALKESGDLGSTGLVMEAAVARKWTTSENALTNVRAALEILKTDGAWTAAARESVRVVAGERFAVFGEGEMTVVVAAEAEPAVIAEELRQALAARDASLARLSAL